MPEAVIVDSVRTPIGRAFKGSMAQLRPDDSGAFIVDQLLERNPDVDPASVEEVIAGRPAAGQAGLQHGAHHRPSVGEAAAGGSTARRSRATARPDSTPSATPATRWVAGQGDTYVAAGVEFVSQYNERQEAAGVADQNESSRARTGQPNVYIQMGDTAVNVAKRYEVSRADMDKYAQRLRSWRWSPRRTASSTARSCRSRFPTAPRSRRTRAPRKLIAGEALKLPEAFEGGGGVTAGNPAG